ncbi:MAG: sugar ABC transporter permease [Spirochaetales bacterium]|nr:sugar ABC transporter permease [Spirochaetales bacterium]
MVIFTVFVFGMGAIKSLTDAARLNPGEFIGFDNYIQVLSDDKFWRAVATTFMYMFGAMLVQIPVAFLLANILNTINKRFRGIFRAAFFIPVLVNSIVLAFLFRQLFATDFGMINWFFGVLGMPNNTDWLRSPSLAVPLLVIVSSWQWMGFHAIYFLANLQSIDVTLYEAAKIDGASPVRVLMQITFPMMKSALTFVMVTSAIGCLQLFDLVYMLFPDNGYVGGTARTIVAYIYDESFSQASRYGYASAAGWVAFFIILAISLLQLRFLGLGQSKEQ